MSAYAERHSPLDFRRRSNIKESLDGVFDGGFRLLDRCALTGDVQLQAKRDVNVFAGTELFAPNLNGKVRVFHKRIVAQRNRIVNKAQKRPAVL